MTARGSLEPMELRFTGKVEKGVIVLEDTGIVDGAVVTVLVDSADLCMPGPYLQLDANGDVIMTPELEEELLAAEAEADRGEGIPWEQVQAELRSKR